MRFWRQLGNTMHPSLRSVRLQFSRKCHRRSIARTLNRMYGFCRRLAVEINKQSRAAWLSGEVPTTPTLLHRINDLFLTGVAGRTKPLSRDHQ